jgi:hypothetical protein
LQPFIRWVPSLDGFYSDAGIGLSVWSLLAEEREIDASVCAVSNEMGMRGEILRLAVLEHEEAVGI